MYKMFTSAVAALRAWLADLAAPEPEADPLSRMTPCELADLPVHHPVRENWLSP